MRTILRISALTLTVVLLGLIAFMLIYPNYNTIILYKRSLNLQQISYSASLQFLTSLSPERIDAYQQDYENTEAVEYMTPEILARLQNEGEVLVKLEKDNTRLVVPSANIDAKIHDGETPYTMMKGPWRFPLSGIPGDRGNLVVFGHRFAELPPSTNTFFNLDQIKVGDKIFIKQDGRVEYSYTVISSKVVDKGDRSVLTSGNDYRMTLVTCTPLWTSKNRLVITGILDKVYRKI